MFVIKFVGAWIHLFSVGYMVHEKDYARFFACMNLFICAMLLLVLGGNLVLLYLGWEGVGLCSYLLIGFWYTDPAKAAAGKKAFVVNRVGDAGFLLGMFALFGLVATLSKVDPAAGAGLADKATLSFQQLYALANLV